MVTVFFSTVGSDRKKLIFLAGVPAILLGLFYVNWIRPARREVGRLETGIAQLETELKSVVTVRDQLKRFTQLLEARRVRLNRLKLLFPSCGESTQIVRQIHDLAVNSRLRIRSMTPQKKISFDSYDAQYIRVVFEGTYHQLGRFFQEISETNWILNVESFELKAVDDCLGGCSLRASCLLAFFFLPEPLALPGKKPKP
jgi:type IV pilus assembly protein PilO